jgi:hypothetical protein
MSDTNAGTRLKIPGETEQATQNVRPEAGTERVRARLTGQLVAATAHSSMRHRSPDEVAVGSSLTFEAILTTGSKPAVNGGLARRVSSPLRYEPLLGLTTAAASTLRSASVASSSATGSTSNSTPPRRGPTT